jgi:hypothetical protein
MKDFTFISKSGEKVSYSDVLSGKFRVTCIEDEQEIVRNGGVTWEYDGWAGHHMGKNHLTPESEYLSDPKKVIGSNAAFQIYDAKFGPLNENSKVIEFGCNMARNLRIAKERYNSYSVGIDISPYVIDRNKEYFGDTVEFYTANFREGGAFLKRFKDNEFDLGITCGFLMHLASNENKEDLIKEIIRVSKTCWFSELRSDNYFYTDHSKSSQDDAATGEDLRQYDDRIEMFSGPGENLQPNGQALYMFKCDQ